MCKGKRYASIIMSSQVKEKAVVDIVVATSKINSDIAFDILALRADLLKYSSPMAMTGSFGLGLAEPGDCQSKCLADSN